MQIKLYNTLSKNITQFEPINHYKVGLYACGFTVYDYTHIGHLRKYTMDDILIRTLRYGNEAFANKLSLDLASYEVKFVQNVTDVGHLSSDADTGEDKLEKGAKKYGKSVWDVAQEFETYFFRSMDLMGNLRPDISCKATDHIQDQLNMVIELEQKGYTYIIEGDGVYFDTSKFPDYGKMAGVNLEDQEEGSRIGLVEGKKNPADFALWKFERPGENRAMSWPSPWAERGFPGWHIECSAMAIKYLGEQFDIHTGGIDHIPVHHTNEIAQAEAESGKSPFVKYWVHHNHLHINGEKMSKSLGNFYTIDDVIKRGFHPLALRMLFLTAHYRSEMNFTWENLAGAQKAYEKLISNFLQIAESELAEIDNLSETAQKYAQEFFANISNDLNTSQALSVIWAVLKDDKLSDSEKHTLLLEFNQIFSLGLEKSAVIWQELNQNQVQNAALPEEIQELLNLRQKARQEKNFTESDRIRDELLKNGYKVLDLADGQSVTRL
jgi:cysteinyl-tRNA synthetase